MLFNMTWHVTSLLRISLCADQSSIDYIPTFSISQSAIEKLGVFALLHSFKIDSVLKHASYKSAANHWSNSGHSGRWVSYVWDTTDVIIVLNIEPELNKRVSNSFACIVHVYSQIIVLNHKWSIKMVISDGECIYQQYARQDKRLE